MKVQPTDIRYMIVGVQKVKGLPTPGVLSKGHATYDDAADKLPIDGRYAHLAKVVGYVSNHRTTYPDQMTAARDAVNQMTEAERAQLGAL